MRNFLIIPILFIFLVSCSNSEDFDIPKISKLEKLEEHSNQFIKGIYSYDNGIHVAIGFGIANSIMVEGCLLYTSPSPRDQRGSRMPSSA